MSTPYEIDISLSPDTVTQLKDEGFALYGFKAVATTIRGAAPLVWFRTLTFLNTTKVHWSEQYQAYISTSAIITNGEIDASANVDMDLGATANVDAAGILTPMGDGTPGRFPSTIRARTTGPAAFRRWPKGQPTRCAPSR